MGCKKCNGRMLLRDSEIDDNGRKWHVHQCQTCGRWERVKMATEYPPVR
jgi:DNA-directed RNA polymerase subunit M/transcription elongation factor TFIIS